MTGSVNEIARQVQESSKIAAEAVVQTGKTDARIAELSVAAARIGDVVKVKIDKSVVDPKGILNPGKILPDDV